MSTLKVSTISPLGTDATKTITIGSASNGDVAAGVFTNVPMFRAKLTSSQSVATGAYTKINLDAVDFDSDNVFNTSTYKFTVPSGQAGKYLIGYSIGTDAALDDGERLIGRIYLNGSGLNYTTSNDWSPGGTFDLFVNLSVIINLSVSDYLELYCFHNEGAAVNINSSYTRFWAQRLIGA